MRPGPARSSHTPLPDFCAAVYTDVNGPLYYLVLYPWHALAGISNAALRFPGMIFGIAAPLVLLWKQAPGLTREEQLTWSALLALWVPGLWDSQDARCFTLLLLFCAAQSVAHARLMTAPTTSRASVWAGLSALAILTQYHALLVTGLQGLAYVAIHRRRAIETWRGALIFLLPGAWLCIHLPKVAAYMQPGVAWYGVLTPNALPAIGSYVVGDPRLLLMVPVLIIITHVLAWHSARNEPHARPGSYIWLTALTALTALAITVFLGFLRPSFTFRYVTADIPGVLLGVTLALRAGARRSAMIYPVVILLFLLTAFGWAREEIVPGAWAQGKTREPERNYNYQIASDFLKQAKPDRLVFIWDHPASRLIASDQLDAMGGFFFRQAGAPIAVQSVVLRQGEDPNPRLEAEGSGPNSVILWLYDIGVRGTSARTYPPRLTEIDPRWQCRNFGKDNIGIFACRRNRGDAADAPGIGSPTDISPN